LEDKFTPRAKTTVIALQPVPSVNPFSVVEVPKVPVLFVAATEMNGTWSRRRLNEERILEILKLKPKNEWTFTMQV
jgi:hypothetical protein